MPSLILEKNLSALSDGRLKNALFSLQNSRWRAIFNPLGVNFEGGGRLLYKDMAKELADFHQLYTQKYPFYPVLYFYGIGGGEWLKILLQNPRHKHIVIFENDLELLWAVLSVVDFSEDLACKRLFLLYVPFLSEDELLALTQTQPFLAFSRTYCLELACEYYEIFSEEILKLNALLMEGFKRNILLSGNDPQDALQGIEQFVLNLPKMLSHAPLQNLIEQRKGKAKNAIIVSTGPSLTKQLPLLKEVQEKAVIFAADSAYPILIQNDIVPDYVCMLERPEITAEFFKHDFKDKDKNCLFILASLVHPKAIEYLEKRGREYILVPKKLDFADYLALPEFECIPSAQSVAHLAYQIALRLEVEHIIFIGQDLAYAPTGESHPQAYQNSATFESEMYQLIKIQGYGGQGEVDTHEIWLFFKQIFEDLIATNPTTPVYNATEGGARIKGAIEKPFSECCAQFLKEKKLYFALPPALSTDRQKELARELLEKIELSCQLCAQWKSRFLTLHNALQEEFLQCENLELDSALLKLESLMARAEEARELEDSMHQSFYEMIQPSFVQWTLNIARIIVLNPTSKEDLFNKNVVYIKEHLEFMQMIYGLLDTQEQTLKRALIPLKMRVENAL